MTESCDTCRFWKLVGVDCDFILEDGPAKVGLCRRYPPKIVEAQWAEDTNTGTWGANVEFPHVTECDWCGEYVRQDEGSKES